MIKIYNSVLEVSSQYKGFILDIWGVLHSSGVPFEGVLNNLTELKKQGKKVILLSNAPRRASSVEAFLATSPKINKGEHYDDILTSGELFYLETKDNFKNKSVIYIGSERDLPLMQNLGVNLVESGGEVAIITGFMPNVDDILHKILQNKTPLYCVNPDIFIKKQDGSMEECAGFLAEKYKKMGGEVIYFGKPYLPIYSKVMDFFENIEKEDILAIGDGMETDILGANNFGITNALCLAGLPSFELSKGILLEDYISQFPSKPNFFIKSL